MSTFGNKLGVFLDLDDTLYSYPPCNRAGEKVLFSFLHKKLNINQKSIALAFKEGRSITKSKFPETGKSHSRLLYLQEALPILTGKKNAKLAQKAHAVFWKGYFSKMKLRPGAYHFLSVLQKKEICVAIVSDFTTEIQIKKLKYLKIYSLTDHLITSEESGKDKPAPHSFHLALKKTKLKPSQVVMIGESLEKDILGARRLGISGILLLVDQDNHTKTPAFRSFNKIEKWLFEGYDERNANRDPYGRNRKTIPRRRI